MGAIHFSIDPRLAALLAGQLGLELFIETGTFKGDSLAAVRPYFRELHSCELSPDLHRAAVERFRDDQAVHCHAGSSGELLSMLAATTVGRPTLFWLDAHWCAAEHAAGAESQCPLLDELQAITPLHADSVVWIDDARYFQAPPPAPLQTRGWPSFQQVLDALRRLSSAHHLVCADDTLLFYPPRITDAVAAHLHTYGADWLAIAHSARLETELRDALARTQQKCDRLRNRLHGRPSRCRRLGRMLKWVKHSFVQAMVHARPNRT